MKCVKITRPDSHGPKFGYICILDGFSARDEFDGAEVGEKVTLELLEMTPEELAALADFGGW
jgi:hypothetical protein